MTVEFFNPDLFVHQEFYNCNNLNKSGNAANCLCFILLLIL